MTFYAVLCGLGLILISMQYLLLNEETFILVSFTCFFIYVLTMLSPQITDSLEAQIDKIKTSIEYNFIGVKKEFLGLQEKCNQMLLKAQVHNLKYVLVFNIRESFKYMTYNLLNKFKQESLLSFQILKELENRIYKSLYIYMYVEITKIISLKQYITKFKTKSIFINKIIIENQELLNKM
uniref:Ymf39 n=1 Tax=Pseudoerythrocladia kornmannii TaxID=753682 RepID=UPI001FCCCCDE|nr:Ymf39 [Pseudoerythrocladia kornmannii]UNJ19035.1 Ymf39 [Pseudoerythrocladia kornmannii]